MDSRKPFEGVLNILSFNRHFYYLGIGAMVVLLISRLVVDWPLSLFWIVLISFGYGLLAPLIVSAYVYDISGFYYFNWLDQLKLNKQKITRICNINAGFDETSFILQDKFPHAHLIVFDFFDHQKHTEPAIKRARQISRIFPNTRQISSNYIPLSNQSIDVIFLISAVHEMRSIQEKIIFLKECTRICKPNGHVIMVEHLRDLPNFLAFTIGVTHFFSKNTWISAFNEAGFSVISEQKFTPFMSIFTCKPWLHSTLNNNHN